MLRNRLAAMAKAIDKLPPDPVASAKAFESSLVELDAWMANERLHIRAWRDHETGELVCPAVRADPCCYKGSKENPVLECDGCLVCVGCNDAECKKCRPRDVYRRMSDEQLITELRWDQRLESLMLAVWGQPRESQYRNTTRKALLEVAKERGIN